MPTCSVPTCSVPTRGRTDTHDGCVAADKLFDSFDSDKSGSVDKEEMRKMLSAAHSKIPRRLLQVAIDCCRLL